LSIDDMVENRLVMDSLDTCLLVQLLPNTHSRISVGDGIDIKETAHQRGVDCVYIDTKRDDSTKSKLLLQTISSMTDRRNKVISIRVSERVWYPRKQS
jgi:hypothetical protein